MNNNITLSQTLLKYAFAVTLIVLGLDQALHTYIITDWTKYVGPLALSVVPLQPTTVVLLLGVVEIIVGILFLTPLRVVAAWLAIIALAAIVVDLFSLGLYDIALRDIFIALAGYVFILLTRAIEAREGHRANT